MKGKIQSLTPRRLSLILTIIALALWSYSVSQAKLVINDFGILNSFPLTYFVALALLAIASFILWCSHESHDKPLLLQLSILIISLLLIPQLIGAGGATDYIKGYFRQTSYVLEHGHLNPDVYWYHQYPINWIFSALLVKILGIKNLEPFFAVGIPFLLAALFMPLMYTFLRNVLKEENRNYCWAGLWLFYLSTWFGFYQLFPQTFGWFYFFTILALFSITLFRQQRTESFAHPSARILSFVSITLSHWLSSIFCLAVVAMLFLKKKIKLVTLMVLAAFIGAWTVYGAAAFFECHLPFFIEHVLRIQEIFQYTFYTRTISGNLAHEFLNKLRFWYPAMFIFLAFLGVILGVKSKKSRDMDFTILALTLGVAIATTVIGYSYRHEILMRGYNFSVPFIAYFGVKALNRKVFAVLLCVILLIAPPLWITSRYANQSIDDPSPANVQGLYFFEEHSASKGTLVGNYYNWLYLKGVSPETHYRYPPQSAKPIAKFLKQPEQYEVALFEQLQFENGEVSLDSDTEIAFPCYLGISQRDKGIYYWYWDKLDFLNKLEDSLNNAKNCDLVYANPGMKLYISERSSG